MGAVGQDDEGVAAPDLPWSCSPVCRDAAAGPRQRRQGCGDLGARPPARRPRARGRCFRKLGRADRSLLAALLHRLPRSGLHQLHLLVSPDTVLGWHRHMLRRGWAATSRPNRAGRPAAPGKHLGPGGVFGQREPLLRLPRCARRTRRFGHAACPVHGVGDLQPPAYWPGTTAWWWPRLGGVPPHPGQGHARASTSSPPTR